MEIIAQNNLSTVQTVKVLALWNNEYPESLIHHSMTGFENYLNTQEDPCHYLLVDDKQELLAYAVTFTRDREKWFSIIVDGEFQHQRMGTIMLNAIKLRNHKLNGWVIDHEKSTKQNGTAYKTPLPFYLKNDFRVIPGVRLENEAISAVKIVWKIG